MENLEIAKKRQFLLDLIWAHSKTPDEVEEAFHDYTSSLRLKESIERINLREENAALRSAVHEMARMLPSLKMLERDYPGAWIDITAGTGIATINTYGQTLETALAKMNEK